MNNHRLKRRPLGFALITSLSLLIVATLLGVSAISVVGLQAHMASNLKEKERANEVAEVAARGAEWFLLNQENLPVATDNGSERVWTLNAPLPNNSIEDLLNDSIWSAAVDHTEPPFDDPSLIGTGAAKYAQPPQSFTEESGFVPATENPDDHAKQIGNIYYRISGRGVGGNPTAVSVVQSIFTKRVN